MAGLVLRHLHKIRKRKRAQEEVEQKVVVEEFVAVSRNASRATTPAPASTAPDDGIEDFKRQSVPFLDVRPASFEGPAVSVHSAV